jgi:hypothetical protein
MSLASTPSLVLLVGAAACAVVALTRPARSWASGRSAAGVVDVCPDQQLSTRGQYPDADVHVVTDYHTAADTVKRVIEIHMEIPIEDPGGLPQLEKDLNSGARSDALRRQLYAEITKATRISNQPKVGLYVLKAAIGCVRPQ